MEKIKPNITDFSHELLCHILMYLPLREILSVAMLCKKMLAAVVLHLQLCKSIDFCQDSIFGYMPSTITDDHLLTLLKKCPRLEIVYGLHPIKIERRRLRKRAALTIPGIIEALSLCFNLQAIETSDLRLFEAIMQHLPQLEIIGHFQNRNGLFPPQASQRLKLQPYPRISSLHLIGVEVPELTAMPNLKHLLLQCVRFTKLQPFRAFLAQNLKSFVMKHCIGPSVPQRYLSLIIALSSAPNLSHLELVRVPLLNGLFQRAVEDSYRHNGFVNLKTLVISGCKGILEADLGHLMIVASKKLETLYIQPSLTKDSLFVSLTFADCSFPVLRNLHLGYIDNLNSSGGEWSNDTLLSFGLAEVPDTPSSLTDSGMKVISRLFPHIKTLSVSNCPHLMVMYQWMAEEDLEAWSKLTDLTLQKCHCLQLSSFVLFISFLPNIQVVILNDMFREPPKGCSHVGLSAGTGLGMSSAVVSNQDEHIAVQGHHQEFEPPGDEENEEIDREFVDAENEDNPEPQFMVLQRDFFDGEDDDDAVDNPPLENNQDPNAEDRGLNITLKEVNNNSVPDKIIVIKKENNTLDNSLNSSPSVNDKCVSPKTVICENTSQDINQSKYCLRNTRKKFKSMSNQIEKDESQNSCYSTDFKEKNGNKDEIYDNDCSNSKNNSKIHLHKPDYDPHKPSTSKAGSHLDYSDQNDDYKCSRGTKRSNVCLNDQNLSKRQTSLKATKDVTPDEKNKKYCKVSSQCNSFENNSNNHCNFTKKDHLNCVKEKLPENPICDIHENSNEIPISFNTDKIPISNVIVENNKTTISKKLSVPQAENKDRTVKVNKLPELNEAQIEENVPNTFISDSDHTIPINCPLVTNEFTDQLSEKKLDMNDVYELSEHEILLDGSFNESNKEIVHKTNVAIIPQLEKTAINSDLLHSSINKNSSASIESKVLKKEILADVQSNSVSTCNKSVATQTYEHDHDDSDSSKKRNSPGESKTAVDISKNKSSEVFKSDLHESDDNLFVKANSFKEITSENLRVEDSYKSRESLEIVKPCYVLVTKIENMQTHLDKYSEDESEKINRKIKDEIPYFVKFEQNAHEYIPTSNEDENSLKEKNLSKCAPLEQSASKAETNICSNTRSENVNFNSASSENESRCPNASEVQNIENAAESNNHTSMLQCTTEPLPLNSKNFKKSSEVDPSYSNYDEDYKYYISVPNNVTFSNLKIIHSITGSSNKIPHCHVVLKKISTKSCYIYQKRSIRKDNQKLNTSEKSLEVRHNISLEFNPHLPSTSRAGCQINNIDENVTNLNDKCEMHEDKPDQIKCFKCKNLGKCCCNYLVPQNCNAERLHIKNSDAMIILKQCDIVKSNVIGTYKLHPEQKFGNQSNSIPFSNNPSYGCKIEENDSESSSSFEEKCNLNSSIRQKRKKRKLLSKRIRKRFIDENNLTQDATKNNAKRISVPMITLISQGTQATSADIRRSVRRIRRVTHRRIVRLMPKKGYAHKMISAQTRTKKQITTVRPESYDKATSTSDPLLEDDVVQTLQLSSSTLLSFSVVSCGISDLIIDQCPKLFHIEVQACRILKRFQFNSCPSIKRLNVSQCPKLNICALASAVMSLSTDSYFLVSYEPCMQGYHPGEGEKAILEKASLNQSVLLLHDFCDISYDGIQAKFRGKIFEWLRFLSQLYLKYTREKGKRKKHKSVIYQFSEYPWSHDLRKIHGLYSYSSSSDFCDTQGQYQLLTNNPIFCDIYETNQVDAGFPDVTDCAAFRDPTLISYEAIEKYLEMQKKFVAFYIPVTESNRMNF